MNNTLRRSFCWVWLFAATACGSSASPGGDAAGGTGSGPGDNQPSDPCSSLQVGSAAGPRGFTQLYATDSGEAQGLQLNDGHLYFMSSKAVMKLPAAGGTPETFASCSGTNTSNGVLSVSPTIAAWAEYNGAARPMRDELYAKSLTDPSGSELG